MRAFKYGFVVCLPLLLIGCNGNLKWYVVSPMTESGRANLLFLLGGLKYTLLLSFTAIAISVVVGLLVGTGFVGFRF